MDGRAPEAVLDGLHGLVSQALVDELRRAMTASSREENPEPINPQLLDKVMKFLTANGVNAPASAPKIDRLAQQLADLDLDDDTVVSIRRAS